MGLQEAKYMSEQKPEDEVGAGGAGVVDTDSKKS